MEQLLILVSVFKITDLLHFYTDYRSGPYTVIFPAGSTSASLYINITDDNIVENNENFVLYIDPLTLPFGTYIISYGSQITVTIYDNDSK